MPITSWAYSFPSARMHEDLHATYNVRNLACVIIGHEISRVASLRIVGCRITSATMFHKFVPV